MSADWREIGRSARTVAVCVVALAVMLPCAPVTAEIIITPNDELGGVGSLNSWSYVVDGMSIQLFEDWGGFAPVGFTISDDGYPGPDNPFAGGTLIDISKNIFNQTEFDWTAFHIDLIPGDGSDGITVDPASVSSDRFSDVMVMNNKDGSASIWYSTDKKQGDMPVLIGESVHLFFTMNIFGDINFNMIQTPIPTPGALALFALAGTVLRRRRRN